MLHHWVNGIVGDPTRTRSDRGISVCTSSIVDTDLHHRIHGITSIRIVQIVSQDTNLHNLQRACRPSIHQDLRTSHRTFNGLDHWNTCKSQRWNIIPIDCPSHKADACPFHKKRESKKRVTAPPPWIERYHWHPAQSGFYRRTSIHTSSSEESYHL